MNYLALNTDYALRTGAFDPSKGLAEELSTKDSDTVKEKALQRYTQAKVHECHPSLPVDFYKSGSHLHLISFTF